MLHPMNDDAWRQQFREVYDRGTAAWKAGRRTPKTMFDETDTAFLAGIGCTAQELFDFVDDYPRYGEPNFDTVVEITAIRRDYFLNVLGGKPTGHVASMADLPAKTDKADGIAWLPRLIAKARLKLRGEMPADLMYGCGGDRPFVREMRTTLPKFLALVRDSGDDDRLIIEAVKRKARLK